MLLSPDTSKWLPLYDCIQMALTTETTNLKKHVHVNSTSNVRCHMHDHDHDRHCDRRICNAMHDRSIEHACIDHDIYRSPSWSWFMHMLMIAMSIVYRYAYVGPACTCTYACMHSVYMMYKYAWRDTRRGRTRAVTVPYRKITVYHHFLPRIHVSCFPYSVGAVYIRGF